MENTNERVENFYKNPENEETSAKRDASLDISALIKNVKPSEEEKITAENTETAKPKFLSPLEQLKLEQEERGSGLIVSNEELEKGKTQTNLKSNIYNDDRINAVEKRIKELDDTVEKRKHVVVLKFPENDKSPEFTELMFELESLTKNEDGTWYFNLDHEPKYLRLRTEEDGEYVDGKTDMELLKKSNSEEEDEEEDSEMNEEKKNIVNIIIDKTGLGVNYSFTEEEKEKIFESQEIHLKEIEFMDIESISLAKTPEKSFSDSMKEFEFSNSKTTICFPGSGFRAQMKGMTYGELGDVALALDSVKYDQYYKRLSVIYNKMTNISFGKFDTFEDFLHGFSYIDISLALYGLYISTQPEVQHIELSCGSCDKLFNWTYNTRSVLDLEKCGDATLKKMSELANAPSSEYERIREESSVKKSKFIKLPYSKIIVEMGLISCYEFLHNFIPVMDEEIFKENFGDDPNNTYIKNAFLLTFIRSIEYPDGNNGYVKYTNFKDILDIIYNIYPAEIAIIGSIANKLSEDYAISFTIRDIVCPHCGAKTKEIEVTMDNLVFQTYRQLMNTEINVENMLLS